MDNRMKRVTAASYGSLIEAGRQAMVRVPGIQFFLLKGFVALYGLSAVLGVAATRGLYLWVFKPWSDHLTAFNTNDQVLLEMLIGLAKALLWLGQFVIMLSCIFLAFRVALSLMTLWSEALVERIIAHRRGAPAQDSFSLALWVKSFGQSLRSSVVSILLSILAIFIAFLPFVGPILALLLNAYLLGRDIRDPYLLVRSAAGEPLHILKQELGGWTVKIGAVPTLVGLVPIIGWVALPALMLYLVAGVAWLAEGSEP